MNKVQGGMDNFCTDLSQENVLTFKQNNLI